jgi:hypothetical protein
MQKDSPGLPQYTPQFIENEEENLKNSLICDQPEDIEIRLVKAEENDSSPVLLKIHEVG